LWVFGCFEVLNGGAEVVVFVVIYRQHDPKSIGLDSSEFLKEIALIFEFVVNDGFMRGAQEGKVLAFILLGL
jgi:hypothetical protein